MYTVAPKALLKRLGIKPHSSRVFSLADGIQITRHLGDAVFAISLTLPPQATIPPTRTKRAETRSFPMDAPLPTGQRAASPVIFGEKGDSLLFGTVSLEALGFILDPMKRELRPLPMVLG